MFNAISRLCNEEELECKNVAFIKMLSLICQFNLKVILQPDCNRKHVFPGKMTRRL